MIVERMWLVVLVLGFASCTTSDGVGPGMDFAAAAAEISGEVPERWEARVRTPEGGAAGVEGLPPEVFDVRQFGADPWGDPAVNTHAIQSAIDEASAVGGEVLCTGGRYPLAPAKYTTLEHTYMLMVSDTAMPLAIRGDCTLYASVPGQNQTGDGHMIILRLQGKVDGLLVEGLTFDGGESTGQDPPRRWVRGIWTASGNQIRGFSARGNHFRNLIEGIALNANDLVGGGAFSDARVLHNTFENIVGTLPGTGYGVSDTGEGNTVAFNVFDRTGRHAIYVANARDHLSYGNVLKGHRFGVSTGQVRPAINIARSRQVAVHGNLFQDFSDSAINIAQSSATDRDCEDIDVRANTFMSPRNRMPVILIGEQHEGGIDPSTGAITQWRTRNVMITENRFVVDASSLDPSEGIPRVVQVLNGEGVSIVGNLIGLRRLPGSSYDAVVLGSTDPAYAGAVDGCPDIRRCLAQGWSVRGNRISVAGSSPSTVHAVKLLGPFADESRSFAFDIDDNSVHAAGEGKPRVKRRR